MQTTEQTNKRLCQRPEQDGLSPSCPLRPCLLPLLQPVRHCLHAFLSSRDAARLMQASRSLTTALLPGYAFVDRTFDYNTNTRLPNNAAQDAYLNSLQPSRKVAAVKRSLALYARYDMRIVCMCLPREWNKPLIDSDSGRSVLPASLLALSTGVTRMEWPPAAFAEDEQRWTEEESGGRREERIDRLTQRWEQEDWWNTSRLLKYGDCRGAFNKRILPGALPHGLRSLHFNRQFNQPLQVGSIPDTVEVLQFGFAFNKPLLPGHLPASLIHLVFGPCFKQSLSAGVLPEGLQRLHLGGSYNQPIQPGSLPPQLRRLHLGGSYTQLLQPGSLPPQLETLEMGEAYSCLLQRGAIPASVSHLRLSERFDQSLLPGVLPASLRELFVGSHFARALQPGSLPAGLRLLAFHPQSAFQHVLQPGVLPGSVIVLSMGKRYKQELVAGGVPASVRWLRLSAEWYKNSDLSSGLSASTRVVWWNDGKRRGE